MSGTIQTKAQLLAEFAGFPVVITPVQMQNLVASVPSLAANAYAPGGASNRFYAGVDPQSTGTVYQPAGKVTVSLVQIDSTTTFTKSGIETMPLIPAARLNDFKTCVGINTHIGNGWTNFTSATNLMADLSNIGFTLIRDTVTTDATRNGVYGTLGAAGYRMIFTHFQETPASIITSLKTVVTNAGGNASFIAGLEGWNEPAGFSNTYNGYNSTSTWQGVMQQQQALYQSVKSDPVLYGTFMLGVSNVTGQPDNCGLQFLTVPQSAFIETTGTLANKCLAAPGTVFADSYNIHTYFVHQPIDSGDNGDHLAGYQSELWYTSVQTFAQNFTGLTYPEALRLPRCITEVGFPTDSSHGTGQYVDQATQGKWLLNTAMTGFVDGFKYVCLYSMYDDATDTSDKGWGMYVAHGTIKSSGTYFKNLFAIMADTGTDFATFNAGSPGNVGFTGLPSLSSYCWFQKSDGSYWLSIWSCPVDWNTGTNAPVTVTGTSVTIGLPQTFSTINVFDPTISSSVQATTSSASTVTITLKDYPLLIQMVPPASTTHIQWAIYAMANGVPTGSPVYTSANHTVPLAADVIEETGLNVTLQPGVYAACVVSDGPCAVRGIADAGAPGLLGLSSSKAAVGSLGFTTSLNTGTPAGSWPTNPSATMTPQSGLGLGPLVWIRS